MRPLDPRLLRYARASRAYLALCVVLGAVTAGLVLTQAWLLAGLISRGFLGGEGLDDLRTPLLVLGLVVAARAVAAWAQEAAAHRAAAAVKSQLRRRLVEHAARLGPAWLAGERSGELATLASRGVDALDGYFARYLPQLVLAGVVPVAVVAVVLPSDTVAAATIALTLPLIPVFMVLVGLSTQRRTQRQWRALSVLAGHFMDVVAGLPTLKVFGRAKAQTASVREVTDRYRVATMGTLRVAFLSALVLELLATLSVALVAVGIGLRLVGGELTLQTALLVLILAPEAYLPLRQVGLHYHASAEGLAAAGRVFEVLDTPVPEPGGRADPPDLRTAPIRLHGVTVRYDGRPAPAVDRLSLTVRPGDVVAITGPSGAGKSTLLAVLLGFLRPGTGRVLVGDVDLDEIDPDAWRSALTWVPQRPHLFAGSIADNVRLAAPDADDAAVSDALDEAGAGPFVAALPDGIHTVLGEAGAGLSAGQRQRVALARAFLRDTPLVLLDEPTANLDGETEVAVVEAVRRLTRGRTVLVVAHRPALLAVADRVVALTEATVAA